MWCSEAPSWCSPSPRQANRGGKLPVDAIGLGMPKPGRRRPPPPVHLRPRRPLNSFVVSSRFSPRPLLLPFLSISFPHRSPACAATRTRRRWGSGDQKPVALVPPSSPWPSESIPHHQMLQFAKNQWIRTSSVSSWVGDVMVCHVTLLDRVYASVADDLARNPTSQWLWLVSV
jgi:hypothetical protein